MLLELLGIWVVYMVGVGMVVAFGWFINRKDRR
jgi:hypothetical protein